LDPASATTEMMTRAWPTAPTRVGPPPPPVRGRRNGKRRRTLPLILALLAILAPLAWAGYSLLQDSQEEPVPQIAVPDLVGKTLEEAQNQVGNDFEIRVEDKVEGEKPVTTIQSQQPEGGKAEKGSTISVVVVGTQVAEVPGVVGKDRGIAEQTLKDAGFEVAVQERESSFDEEDLVIGQVPESGTTQAVGSEVTITVGTGPSTVEVPDLYGNTPDQAAALLGDVGLKLGAVSEDYSADVVEGGIIYQDPVAGERVEPGSVVNVTISLGPEQVEVPNVYGLDLETAQLTVANAGLNSEIFEVENNAPYGTALSTEPQAGSLVDPGVTVTIYYSGGPPPEPAPPRPDSGQGTGPRVGENQNQGEGNSREARGGDSGN
jgi:beta-lactam-binding protein with PASTA domain